jgi:hypothetical protein
MSALISWLIGTVARWVGGSTAKATSIVGWIGLALVLGGMVGTGWIVHRYDAAQHRAAIAEIKATAATAQAAAEARARDQERRNDALSRSLEESYETLSEARAEGRVESARLSGLLRAALERLRQHGGSGGDGRGVPGPADGPGGCADLRSALARTARAVELLQDAGDRVAADGQRAVDVATIAADAARAAAVTPEAAR